MSELQNRIIQRLNSDGTYLQGDHVYSRQEQYLRTALALYFSMGGTVEKLNQTLPTVKREPYEDIGDRIADVVVEIAAVSHARDLDMVQAAFNWIDKRA